MAGRLPFATVADAFSPALQGILWMSAASLFYGSTYIIVRQLSGPLSAFELVFFRVLFAAALMLPWLMRNGLIALRTKRLGLYSFRTAISYAGMVCWFFALGHLRLAEATALMFTIPMFTVLFAAVALREAVEFRRMAAMLVGFSGALLILRPGVVEISIAALAVLFTAMAYSISNVSTKILAATEDTNAIVFYMFSMMVPLSAGPAIYYWVTPGWEDVPWILAMGALTGLGVQCFTRSLAAAPTGVVMPFFYLQMPFVAAGAFIAFGEVPDEWTWAGASVICASGYYIARRESRTSRKA